MGTTLCTSVRAEEQGLYDIVTPGAWTVAAFQPFRQLTPDEEFDLLAPVLIYLDADLIYGKEARNALNRLKALDHPFVRGVYISEVLEGYHQFERLQDRYNALMMVIADDVIPGIRSHIDRWGAFAFSCGDDACVLAGDKRGTFAYYIQARLVRERLKQAKQAAAGG